jgi:hypothetical protein
LRDHTKYDTKYERRWEAFVREEGTQFNGEAFKIELTRHSKS